MTSVQLLMWRQYFCFPGVGKHSVRVSWISCASLRRLRECRMFEGEFIFFSHYLLIYFTSWSWQLDHVGSPFGPLGDAGESDLTGNSREHVVAWISLDTRLKLKRENYKNNLFFLVLHAGTSHSLPRAHARMYSSCLSCFSAFLTCLPPCVQSPCCSTGNP